MLKKMYYDYEEDEKKLEILKAIAKAEKRESDCEKLEKELELLKSYTKQEKQRSDYEDLVIAVNGILERDGAKAALECLETNLKKLVEKYENWKKLN